MKRARLNSTLFADYGGYVAIAIGFAAVWAFGMLVLPR